MDLILFSSISPKKEMIESGYLKFASSNELNMNTDH